VEYEKAIGEGNSAFRLQEIRPGIAKGFDRAGFRARPLLLLQKCKD
jgi:hypothetical protein